MQRKNTPKLEDHKVEVMPIYRPDDLIIVKVEQNMEFRVISAGIVDGQLMIEAEPSGDWEFRIPGSLVVCRSSELMGEAKKALAS